MLQGIYLPKYIPISKGYFAYYKFLVLHLRATFVEYKYKTTSAPDDMTHKLERLGDKISNG